MPLWGSSPRVVYKDSSRRHRDDRDADYERDPSLDEASKSRPRGHVSRRKSESYHSSSSGSRPRRRDAGTAAAPKIQSNHDLSRSDPSLESRSSLPYPKFSKAHSREALTLESAYGNDSAAAGPQRTGSGRSDSPREDSVDRHGRLWQTSRAPPSPPLTAAGSGELNPVQGKRRAKKRRDTSPARHLRFSASRTSLRNAEEGRSSSNTSARSSLQRVDAGTSGRGDDGLKKQASKDGSSARSPMRSRMFSRTDLTPPTEYQSSGNPVLSRAGNASPASEPDTQPRTPLDEEIISVDVPDRGKNSTPIIEVFASTISASDDQEGTILPPAVDVGVPPAPPPPPPPPPFSGIDLQEVPRVDYLLQNGGLPKQIPRNFSAADRPPPPQSYLRYAPSQSAFTRAADMAQSLAPYQDLLDKFEQVIRKNGSVAVATGYKSVARRLLDRLEAVFSRNISSELCTCAMCNADRSSQMPAIDHGGVSWGEVLELVSGRRDLPVWPPFSLHATNGADFDGLEHELPMQKLDIDVPEEYREHYIRQSKKTKLSVDKWLASQPEDQPSPPSEVDDETLTFAMLTYLAPMDRRVFTALIWNSPEIPDPRSPTPKPSEHRAGADNDLGVLSKTATAIQRLYRLGKPPRDPECAMYLLKNPDIHGALATLAAISNDEWEILVSGRFDGFLVSGAESRFPSFGPIPQSVSTPGTGESNISRGPTPFRRAQSRGSMTPSFQHSPGGASSPTTPGPVQVDEETEIAVLAEVEREIYLGMDALEDAMEALHMKAETVRKALRERSAGLGLQSQRRGMVGEELRAVIGTPFVGRDGPHADLGGDATPARSTATPVFGSGGPYSHHGNRPSWDAGDGMDDAASLAPDDSASNVGWREQSKHRQRKRRPRRVEEAVEEEES